MDLNTTIGADEEDTRIIPIKALEKKPLSEAKLKHLEKARNSRRKKKVQVEIKKHIEAKHETKIKDFVSEIVEKKIN